MRRTVWSFCFVLILCLGLYPSNSTAEDNAKPDPSQTVLGNTTVTKKYDGFQQANNLTEVAVLRAQLELAEKYQDRIVAAVYWSLGSLCAVFLGLIGLGWFANFKIYDRDRAALSKEMADSVSLELSSATKIIVEEVEGWKKVTVESLESAISNSINESQGEVLRLRNYVEKLEIKISRLQAELWISKKIHGNAFRALIRAAQLAQHHGNTGEVARSLNEIEKVVRGMDGIFPSDLREISAFLEEIDDAESTHVSRLRLVLDSARTL